MKRPFPWLSLLAIVLLFLMNMSAQYTIHSQKRIIEGWRKLGEDCVDSLKIINEGVQGRYDVDESTKHNYLDVVDHAPKGSCELGMRPQFVKAAEARGAIYVCSFTRAHGWKWAKYSGTATYGAGDAGG